LVLALDIVEGEQGNVIMSMPAVHNSIY